MNSLLDITARRAAIDPDAIAFHVVQTGEQIDYRRLEQRSACAASLLQERGVSAGDRVAVLCRNRVEFFELLFACAKLGAILVPLNWRMPAGELVLLLEDCTPALMVTGMEDRETALAASEPMAMTVLDLDADYSHLRDAILPHPGNAPL